MTGVVNFVLRDDYEGMEFEFKGGVSDESDADSYGLTWVWGNNFDNDRGNITMAFQYDKQDGIKQGDRDYLSGDGLYDNDTNPALRFQIGDIDASATPNFSEFYNFDNARFLDRLAGKGFFIAENSRSNYSNTISSIARRLRRSRCLHLAEPSTSPRLTE